jgi:BASS family bile acid:Na+ symporter
MRLESALGSLSLFIFAGFAIGLVIGDPTGMSASISMIALGAIMTLSMSDMVLELGDIGSGFIKGLVPALMTFGILTPVFIAASFFFDGQLRLGWMLAAAMPAAVAIVPYSERMRGDLRLALHGEIAIYLLALALTPAIAIVMLNASVDVAELLKVLLLLIIVPLALSRLVKRARFSERVRGTATNLAFLFFTLIVVGANRNVFFQEIPDVLALAIASFVTVFGVGLLVDRGLKGMDDPRRKTLTMFATFKNTGLAIAVALTIGMPEMAMPPTMLLIFEMIWVIYLSSWKYNRKGSSNRAPT